MITVEEIRKILGKTVFELRTQKGLTQEQLAEYLSISTHSVTRIETGKTFVSGELISQLCNLFGVAPSVLFTPKPQILYEEHTNYIKEIQTLLPGFNSNRLKEIYNILLVMKK